MNAPRGVSAGLAVDDVAARARRVRMVLLDVDGVLTDGTLRYGPDGNTERDFFVRDGSAIKLLSHAGILAGIITGREAASIAVRARDLGLAECLQGRRVKEPAWDEVLQRHGLTDDEVAYMGDDFLDLALLRRAGLAAAPSDASPEALAASAWVATSPGGRGAVRELIELILRARGAWDACVGAEMGSRS